MKRFILSLAAFTAIITFSGCTSFTDGWKRMAAGTDARARAFVAQD